jgi:hypothetical protein
LQNIGETGMKKFILILSILFWVFFCRAGQTKTNFKVKIKTKIKTKENLEKTEKHQENEVNDEELNWNNVKRGNLKYW